MIFVGCAVPQIPTGGDKDITPPGIVEEKSTPNFQTNFTSREITITFDEWVVLDKVQAQLITAPLMAKLPEVKLKGKAMIVNLPDELLDNTTYTLQFGSSIRDLNENNTLDNFSFVFSTGPKLDSASLAGRVLDAVTLKPIENVWVSLYPFEEDSAVFKRKPDYIARTNKDGQWKLANLRADSFRIFGIKDENLNYIADLESEWMGWLDMPVVTNVNSQILPDIYISPRIRKDAVVEVIHRDPGLIRIPMILSGPRPDVVFKPVVENAQQAWSGDTLLVFYPASTPYAGQVILGDDTTRIRVATAPSPGIRTFNLRPLTQNVYPKGDLIIHTGTPVLTLDSSKFVLTNNTNDTLNIKVTTSQENSMQILLKTAWEEGGGYVLKIHPGAVSDFRGRSNDTITTSFTVQESTRFGDLILVPTGLDSTKQYILYLKGGETLLGKYIIRDVASTQIRKDGLLSSRFTVEIIEDLNRNEYWDTGDYTTKRQPEKRLIYSPEGFRAGWEVEVTLNWQ